EREDESIHDDPVQQEEQQLGNDRELQSGNPVFAAQALPDESRHAPHRWTMFFEIVITAGPRTTTNSAGRMKVTSGKTILTGSFPAFSRAHWRRRSLISWACVRRTRPIGIPSASACTSASTKFDTSCTSMRVFMFCSAI